MQDTFSVRLSGSSFQIVAGEKVVSGTGSEAVTALLDWLGEIRLRELPEIPVMKPIEKHCVTMEGERG